MVQFYSLCTTKNLAKRRTELLFKKQWESTKNYQIGAVSSLHWETWACSVKWKSEEIGLMDESCHWRANLKRMLLLSVGSEWTRSIAMLMALALVSALKSSYVAFHGARKPILKCSSCWCRRASVVATTTVAMTTSDDVIFSPPKFSLVQLNCLRNIKNALRSCSLITAINWRKNNYDASLYFNCNLRRHNRHRHRHHFLFTSKSNKKQTQITLHRQVGSSSPAAISLKLSHTCAIKRPK